jgi:ectoine hydroxylase-related dioxygenase (phytanoyl-CoA dioxygenase family)
MIESLATVNGRPDAISAYWRDGFLFPLGGLSAAEAAAARAEFETVERDWLDAGLPLPLNTYKRINAHLVMPLVDRIARTARILDAVEGVLGPDILLFSGEFFVKEPRTTHVVTMHQDLTYWGLGAIDGLVTVWVPLSPATARSGCMEFVAGSHKNAILPHTDSFDPNNLLSRGQEVAVEVRPEDKTLIELAPGQISLHHGLTIHGSGPNVSDDRRIACVLRYIRPDMAPREGERTYAVPMRGEDRHGNFTHAPAPKAYFEPEALALYDEIRRAQAQVMMKGAKGSADFYV